MLESKKMKRLNELAKKKKNGVLTEDERVEQEGLRREYLAVFRSGMAQTLEGVTVVDPDGNDVTPEKIKQLREDKFIQ